MAQRLKSCSKTTNFETIHCEGYLSSLTKEAPVKQTCGQRCSCPRIHSVPRSKTSSAVLVLPSTPPNLKSRPGSFKQQNLLSSHCLSNPANVLHKEVIGDNSALVEVTVRARANRKSRKSAHEMKSKQRQPWANLLKSSQSTEIVSTFGCFDPLRTLHFLGKELVSVLKSHNGDTNVSKIVIEMLDALNRIPPEVSSTFHANKEVINKGSSSEIKVGNLQRFLNNAEPPEKLTNILCPRRENKVCQTVIDSALFVKTETMDKQLQVIVTDLDKKCKELEDLCKCLKADNEQLQVQFRLEKDQVQFLRTNMEDLQTERVSTDTFTINQLTKENELLQAQIKSLQMQVDFNQGSAVAELKCVIDELEKQKGSFENENMSLQHKLTIAQIEKEKYLTVLAIRDRQVKDILSEMSQLQEVVNEELVQFQKTPPLSQMSSDSTVLANWQQCQNESRPNYNREVGDKSKAPYPSTDNLINRLLHTNDDVSGMLSFRELLSFDSSSSNLDSGDSKLKKLQDSEVPSKLVRLYKP